MTYLTTRSSCDREYENAPLPSCQENLPLTHRFLLIHSLVSALMYRTRSEIACDGCRPRRRSGKPPERHSLSAQRAAEPRENVQSPAVSQRLTALQAAEPREVSKRASVITPSWAAGTDGVRISVLDHEGLGDSWRKDYRDR